MAERKQRIDPEVRAEEIAAAARVLFSEKGIGRTSIKDVAERAGIARGLVYYYFPDKDALVDAVFEKAYSKEFFIRLLGRGGYPSTKEVRGSNFCDIAWHIDARTHRVIVLSAIDNLVKGTAGAAIQSLNLALGLPEELGLNVNGVAP